MMRQRRWPWISAALGPAIVLVVAVVAIPVGTLALEQLRVADLVHVWGRPGVWSAVWFSTWQAALSTAATLLLGLAPTWVVTRYRFRGRTTVRLLLTAPFVLPTVVVGAAFLAVFPDSLDRSVWAIVLAHVFFNLALVVRVVGPAWALVDDELLQVARTLGASTWQIWRHLLLPVARPAITAAAGLVSIMCFTSFGVVRILGGSRWATVDVEIYRRAVQLGDTSGATVLAIVQTLVMVIAVASGRGRRRLSLLTVRPHRRSLRPATPMALLVAGLSALAMSVPLLALVGASLRSATGFSLQGWRLLFGFDVVDRLNIDGAHIDLPGVVTTSLAFAVVATVIAVPIGLAAAVGLSRSTARSGATSPSWFTVTLSSTMMLALATSAVVIGFGILVAYDHPPFDVRSSWWLVPLVHAAVALPFVVHTATPVLQSIPADLRHAASLLGASPRRRFMTIDLPLMRPAITSSLAMSGALSLGEFGATSFLTRRDTETLPIAIDRLLSRAGQLSLSTAMAAATFLLVLTMAVATLVEVGERS